MGTGGDFWVNRSTGIKSDIQCLSRSKIMWGKENMRQDDLCPSLIGGGGGGGGVGQLDNNLGQGEDT